jgi:hypothetical protein
MLELLWDGLSQSNKFEQNKAEDLNLTTREINLIMMYREIHDITKEKVGNYSYFDIVYKTTETMLKDLKSMSRFPELDALKANVKKRMERKNE